MKKKEDITNTRLEIENTINNESDSFSQVEDIDEDTQKEVLEKYDSDSATREFKGKLAVFIKYFAIAMSLFHIFTSIFGLLETIRHRAMHLLFVLPLCFLLYKDSKNKTNNPTILDYIFSILSIIGTGYIVIQYEQIFLRGGIPNNLDVIMGIMTITLVILAVNRVVGKQLSIIALVFLAYAFLGRYMPGVFAHRGATLTRLVDHLYMVPEGIFSVALGTSATFIALFIIFAAFLERSGLSGLIKDLAMALAGSATGGPAKVSVLSSSLFGSISGSAAANVVTTGAFTIPLMKSTGYSATFAGAVEAVASTGGQFMPPIMGSAAFIMADYLGKPYVEVMKASIIPVLLYYTSCFLQVHIRAKKLGLKGVPRDKLPKVSDVLKARGHLLIPFVAVIYLLIKRYTPLYAGSVGIVLCILSAALKKETRMSLKDIIWALETGAKNSISVAIACASVGIVIGVFTLTGLSTTLATYIIKISQGNFYLTLFLVMFMAIIMGMGLPTVAVYVLLSSVAVPVLAGLDIPLLSAHFFVFYFGLMANVTPPVAIPAYAAAGLSGANPTKTGWAAFKLALAGFFIPYLFVIQPKILMIDTSILGAFISGLPAVLAIIILGIVVENYFIMPLKPWQRVVLSVACMMLLHPAIWTDIVGIINLVLLGLIQVTEKRKSESVIV